MLDGYKWKMRLFAITICQKSQNFPFCFEETNYKRHKYIWILFCWLFRHIARKLCLLYNLLLLWNWRWERRFHDIYTNNINFLQSILHELSLFSVIDHREIMQKKVKKLHRKLESKRGTDCCNIDFNTFFLICYQP